MNIRRAFMFFLLIFITIGCVAPSQPTVNTVSTQTSIEDSSSDSTPHGELPTPLSISTLSAIQKEKFIDLLTAETCMLPCYLGIAPGATTYSDAQNVLIKTGAILRTDYKNFYEGDAEKPPLHLSSYVLNYQDADLSIDQDINIVEKDGKVQLLIDDVFGNFQPQFYNGWIRYSAENVLKNYGMPDEILIQLGERSYRVRVVYLNKGAIIEWTGLHAEDSPDYNICLGFSKENISNLMIVVADSSSSIEIVPSSYMGIKEMYKPIEEVSAVGRKEFYDEVIQDPNACFTVKFDS